MKALFLTNRVPFPPKSGYPIVVYNTIKGLLALGVEITLFSINPIQHWVDTDDIYDPVFESIQFHSYEMDAEISIWDAVVNIFSNQPLNVYRFYADGAAHALENILKEAEFDIIQFESLFVVPYLDIVKANSKARLVYRAHNIVYDVWERVSQSEKFGPRRQYLQFLASRLKAYEMEQINRFHKIFAISEPDRQNILKIGCEVSLDVFPVALDFSQYKAVPTITNFPTLFHLGSMDWGPNREGIEWFLSEVWPDIEELNSELRFYIAGKNMPKHLFDYDSDNVVVEGQVLDAVEFINSKAIMIVPLLSGSGMRVKILEGMAMNKCVIATTIAAEGIQCEHGKDILLADTPDEFYRCILQCITNPTKWKEIGDNARKTAERHYDIASISARMYSAYKQLLNA
ncbi:MAG: glycosyl transferase family 4 [Pedobacter sp.]|nr:glycosyl transferase family 4 [Pedobacter sp.]